MRKRCASKTRRPGRAGTLVLALLPIPSVAASPPLPAEISQQLPRNYAVLADTRLAIAPSARAFRIVALAIKGESSSATLHPGRSSSSNGGGTAASR